MGKTFFILLASVHLLSVPLHAHCQEELRIAALEAQVARLRQKAMTFFGVAVMIVGYELFFDENNADVEAQKAKTVQMQSEIRELGAEISSLRQELGREKNDREDELRDLKRNRVGRQ